MITVKI